MCTILLFVDNLLTKFRETSGEHLRPYLVRRFQRIKLSPVTIRKNFLIGGVVPMKDKIFTQLDRSSGYLFFVFSILNEAIFNSTLNAARTCGFTLRISSSFFIYEMMRPRRAEIMCN